MMNKIQFLTAGESHGKGLLGILDGIPAGLDIDEEFINRQLARRQKGHGRGKRMQIENDQAEIYSGVRFGKTLGSPVGLILPNRDYQNWQEKMSVKPTESQIKPVTLPRPGHADLAGIQKFGFGDIRNVLERSSARETAMRVALAAVCRKFLETFNIHIASRVTSIYNITDNCKIPSDMPLPDLNKTVDLSPVRCFTGRISSKMVSAINSAAKAGDSVGGTIQVLASGLPYGLGSYTGWNKKLQAEITAAIMSINAIKGVEIGPAFEFGHHLGSETHDEIGWDGKKYTRYSNHAGGIEGGMSNGQLLDVRAVMKPIPTLIKPLRSIDIHTKIPKDAHKERTDSCAVPAASIVAEAMIAFVLTDAILNKFGGDSMDQVQSHMQTTGRW